MSWELKHGIQNLSYSNRSDENFQKQLYIDREYQLIKYGFYTIETRCSENIKTIELSYISSSQPYQKLCNNHK